MAFAAAEMSDLARRADGLQQALAGVIKQLDLGIQVHVETVSTPMVMTLEHAIDFIFTAKTTLNEAQNFADFGLPFKTRLKAVLQTLVVGLPHTYPAWRWCIPHGGPVDPRFQPDLTVENLEATLTFSEITHVHGGEPSQWLHGTRFRIRAIETLEARLARK